MADPTAPASIAKKLTQRQREAMLWLPTDGSERADDGTPYLSTSMAYLGGRTIAPDIEAVLVVSRIQQERFNGRLYRGYFRLTGLGVRVRKVLADG